MSLTHNRIQTEQDVLIWQMCLFHPERINHAGDSGIHPRSSGIGLPPFLQMYGLILVGDQRNRFDMQMDETRENKGVVASITPAALRKGMENLT